MILTRWLLLDAFLDCAFVIIIKVINLLNIIDLLVGKERVLRGQRKHDGAMMNLQHSELAIDV